MDSFEPQRRSFLAALGALGMIRLLPARDAVTQPGARHAFVLGPGDGEHLLHFRDGGSIVISLGTATGSPALAMGTQQVRVGTGIPIHRHFAMDEAFQVLAGRGTVVLDDVRHPIEQGSTVFIPKNSWHGFENPDQELLLHWVVSPAGLDGFFRDTCSPPGSPAKSLTREQIREIARRYDTEFR